MLQQTTYTGMPAGTLSVLPTSQLIKDAWMLILG